ncbi:GNAT family N-acetyltransferase [uncultured Neptuniibacter sp.]|uniref:GNAT family N-acetyltransferase n=1 Tax=uncultured Neptuniibacter sp. TaxID=502143 RepID=UPI002628C04B|nr:GNAT family N-acetyltransferase [uncultured Neptuniibacter sp.]
MSALGSHISSPALGRFYKRNGHKGRIQPEDRCFWLERDGAIVAAARLSPLEDKQPTGLLRGLWVERELRGQQLGGKLFMALMQQVEPQSLYCFAYHDAVPFYLRHGFTQTLPDTTPTQLIIKQQTYQQRGSDTCLLYHPWS